MVATQTTIDEDAPTLSQALDVLQQLLFLTRRFHKLHTPASKFDPETRLWYALDESMNRAGWLLHDATEAGMIPGSEVE